MYWGNSIKIVVICKIHQTLILVYFSKRGAIFKYSGFFKLITI